MGERERTTGGSSESEHGIASVEHGSVPCYGRMLIRYFQREILKGFSKMSLGE